MTMANGTSTHNGDKKLAWKPRKTSTEIKPDAPEGEWEALIPKGKCKVLVTQNGDPRLLIPFKLVTANDDRNEAHQGSEVTFSVIIFDDEDAEKRRGANMMKTRLRSLCNALDIDFGEVYPTEVNEPSDFDPLFAAIEGKRITIWTTHSKRLNAQTGEEQTDTEVRFAKPGSGLKTVSKDSDEDEDDRPAKTKKKVTARR
jgi:hypothetical protein